MTLVELLVVISIVAVLAGIAVPPLSRMVASTAVSSHVNAFMEDSRFARGQAMRAGMSVTMCRSATPEAAEPTCATGATAGGWESGWIVFVDQDANNVRAASEPLLRVQQALSSSGGIASASASAFNSLRFRGNGWSSGATASVNFLPKGSAALADGTLNRTVCISIIGRVRVLAKGETTC